MVMNKPSWTQGPPKTILLATDLSSRCDRAMDRAAQLASLWGARLVVLNVLEHEYDFVEPAGASDLPS
jgi:nucleotide-binding universal stress UspA family protein